MHLGLTGTFNNEDSGYYVGGGVELVLSNDVWGFMPKTSVLGEIGVEYRRFDSNKVTQAVPTTSVTLVPLAGLALRGHLRRQFQCESATHDAERQRLAQDQVQ